MSPKKSALAQTLDGHSELVGLNFFRIPPCDTDGGGRRDGLHGRPLRENGGLILSSKAGGRPRSPAQSTYSPLARRQIGSDLASQAGSDFSFPSFHPSFGSVPSLIASHKVQCQSGTRAGCQLDPLMTDADADGGALAKWRGLTGFPLFSVHTWPTMLPLPSRPLLMAFLLPPSLID